jgi:hypothetical protein
MAESRVGTAEALDAVLQLHQMLPEGAEVERAVRLREAEATVRQWRDQLPEPHDELPVAADCDDDQR